MKQERFRTSCFVFTDYIQQALKTAVIERLEDGSVAALIPSCRGVVAFGHTEAACLEELQATLESWMLLSIQLGHPLPVFHGINLNREPFYEPDYRL